MATQTNVETEKLAGSKSVLEDGLAQYKAASDRVASALARLKSLAGDEHVDGGLPTRADKGRQATGARAQSTGESGTKDATAVEGAHRQYTPQDEEQHDNIQKTSQEHAKVEGQLHQPSAHHGGAGHQQPSAAGGGGADSQQPGAGGSGSGAGFQMPQIQVPQFQVPQFQIPEIPLPDGGDQHQQDQADGGDHRHAPPAPDSGA